MVELDDVQQVASEVARPVDPSRSQHLMSLLNSANSREQVRDTDNNGAVDQTWPSPGPAELSLLLEHVLELPDTSVYFCMVAAILEVLYCSEVLRERK